MKDSARISNQFQFSIENIWFIILEYKWISGDY